MFAEPCSPQRGIVAGSSAATRELKVFMNSLARELLESNPRASLGWFMDDLSVDSSGNTEREVITQVGAAGRQMIDGTRNFGLEIAEDWALLDTGAQHGVIGISDYEDLCQKL